MSDKVFGHLTGKVGRCVLLSSTFEIEVKKLFKHSAFSSSEKQ